MGSYNPVGGDDITELAVTGVDANASTTTASLEIDGKKDLVFQVLANTGTHGTHVITLQCSLDDSNWTDISGATLTGVGVKGGVTANSQFVRLKVTTVESATSTVDIIVQAK